MDQLLGHSHLQVLPYLPLDGGLVLLPFVGVKGGLYQPCPERIVRSGPALVVVPFVPQGVKVFSMARRGNIQGFTRAQVNTGHQDVNVDTAPLFPVLHGGQVHVLPVQSGKGQRFEVVQHRADLSVTGDLFLRPGDHRTPVSMLKIERVRDGGELLRITPQHRHPGPFLALVVVTVQQIGRRTAALAGAMSQELNHHAHHPPGSAAAEAAAAVPRRSPRCCVATPAAPPCEPGSLPGGIRSQPWRSG